MSADPTAAAPRELPLADHTALVTGGGSGIGLACAQRLVGDGASVMLMGRRPDRLADAARVLRAVAPPGADIETTVGDVAVEADVAGAVEAAGDLPGELRIAVAAAGMGSMAPVVATDRHGWDEVLATNLTGVMLVVKHVGAAAIAAGGGSLVAVSSIAGHASHRWMAAYGVSKAGVDMLVRTAADELGRHGVRVNSVRPGLVATELTDPIVADSAILADYHAQMPLGRLGSTDDVASLVRFLVGPESSWITGETIHVDGGHHLRRGPDLDAAATALFGDGVVGSELPPPGT
jgi:NAD(P)-dependent dehydrogenase (short-subunit alcohol dehydrogenase family)